ncbi:protein claret segregational [Euwallacea similis]|uniref:protein claret segregational n=1 Tax=Euwallacea similis TaxID=1736056 RepID=UPI00344BCC09
MQQPKHIRSGIRPPQIRTLLRPLGTLSENSELVLPKTSKKAHEAPALINQGVSNALARNKLRRRSKSFTDLRCVNNKPVSLDSLKVPLKLPAARKIPGPAPVRHPISKSSTNIKPEISKVTVGAKRPLPNKSDEGVQKAKVKKIPDWDYKARFLQAKERIQQNETLIANLKQELTETFTVKEELVEMKKHLMILKNEKQSLELKLITFEDQKKELQEARIYQDNLEKRLQEKEEERIKLEEIIQSQQALYNECLDKNLTLTKKFNIAQDKNCSYEKQITTLESELTTLKNDLTQRQLERRILHNTIQDLKGNIRVFCRVRPVLDTEENKLQTSIEYVDETSFSIRKSRESVNQITGKTLDMRSDFSFDKVFAPCTSQEEVFEDLAQLVQSALDGYHVCVFAYGQTGSGKTFTMQGTESPAHQGMIPRTVRLVFDSIEKLERCGWKYGVQVSFLEIYNENVRDLLNLHGGKKLNIQFNEGKETTVTNMRMESIKSARELEVYMTKAQQFRATAATDFNEHSSRSHAITKIFLRGINTEHNITYNGSINLVDLAGSENAKQAVAGERLTETKNINKSLSTLGDVILALHSKAKHVPYRNSKLTYLLQSCLGGNSKTLMIVNISPLEECFGESISSLRFASKVKEVKTISKRNKATINHTLQREKSAVE